jgi:hypothetical protein
MRDAAVSGWSPYAKATSAAHPRTPPYLASAYRIAISTSAAEGRELAEMALVNSASARAATSGSVLVWTRVPWTACVPWTGGSLLDIIFITRGCIQNRPDGKDQPPDVNAELDAVASTVQEGRRDYVRGQHAGSADSTYP